MSIDMLTLAMAKKMGGGGASSWNDLKDRPFYSETGLFPMLIRDWDDNVTEIKDLTLEFVNGDYQMKNVYADINYDVKYTVVWDGVEYECERVDDPEEGFAALGSVSDGHPFCFVRWDGSWSGIRVFAYDANGNKETGNTTHTISVYAFEDKVVTIAPKYLPKAEAVYDVYSAPTADDFNELLRVLREAGYMAE